MRLRKGRVAGLIMVLFVLLIIGIFIGSSRWLRVNEHVVYFDNLPEHLQGLRILHISDLHSNNPDRMNLNIWRRVERLDFDIAVITGDIVLDGRWPAAGPMTYLDPHKPYLRALAARVPTFFIEGNHESRTIQLFKDIMEELGITFLYDDRYFLEVGGGHLEIIGTKDYITLHRSGFHEMYALFEASNPADFRLVLSHQPQIFDRIKNKGQMLVLSGHTHGGQIRLPFMPTLYAPGQGWFPAYGDGFYHHGAATMYVSRGIGTTHFRMRFWNRPAITIHELQARQ
ncbi:MAG: metallophosphoesterase [Defluviitaleaceae bacterium]|nr:metallophosphoesterase [Defluviitaleaceae bacterium]